MIEQFEYYAEHLPLELFVLIGNFLEEIISPLPSFVVLLPAGAAAEVRGGGVLYLVLLSVIAGAGRIVAAVILYGIARKSEEALFRHDRRILGISHNDVAELSNKLGKTPWRDWTILFLMNGTPLFPTAPLSLACGFVKVPFRLFLTSTFAGSVVNGFTYLWLGYAGLKSVQQLEKLETAGTVATVLLVLVAGVLILRWQRLHRKSKTTKKHR